MEKNIVLLEDEPLPKYSEEEMVNLQKEVRQLTGLFEDVNTLVMTQQQGLDRIEDFVYSASANVSEGNSELITAKKYVKVRRYLLGASLVAVNIPLGLLIGPQFSIPLTLAGFAGYKLASHKK